MQRPIVAVTLGDPAGIGPEIVAKALVQPEVHSLCRPVVVGDPGVLEQAVRICGLPNAVDAVDSLREAGRRSDTIPVLGIRNVDLTRLKVGTVQSMSGRAAYEYLCAAVKLARAGEVDAITTAPINKESLRAAGIPQLDHTAILGALTGVADPLAMFEVRRLRVFFLSRHVSLRQACELVTRDRLLDYLIRCSEALDRLGVEPGPLAVAGLNPHCGEHGLFGSEEIDQIAPAIRQARARGCQVEGPVPADAVFHLALNGRYRAVLSLYHDQGHVAAKTVDFERAVAITTGLPFLRTSVDHGTAFDIAGTGAASAVNLVEAIRAAVRYAPCFAGSPATSEGVAGPAS